jgi:hypothetical protein
MSLYPVAGCRFFIGGEKDDQADDFVAADFTSETWVEVDGYKQMGDGGDTAALITTPLINRGRDNKQKGTNNAGSRQDQFALIPDDEGQIALIAASKTRKNYAFKVEFNDAATSPASPAPKPSMQFFVGLVMSAVPAGGDANTIRQLNATIEVNSNYVDVAANP